MLREDAVEFRLVKHFELDFAARAAYQLSPGVQGGDSDAS